MQCECLEACPFFHDRMKNMPTMAGLLKQQFCLGEWAACARCMVFKALGRDSVPPDLFPDETARARDIINEART